MQITVAISLCAECDEYITAAIIRQAVVAAVASGLTKQELMTAMSKVYDDLSSRDVMKQANAPGSRSMQ